MRSFEYSLYLQTHIYPWCKPASGGRVVNCRCFYCQDSSNINHGHFYISMPTNDSPSLYYCQKCKAKGLVTPNKLLEWGLFDTDISNFISAHNKKIFKNPLNIKYKDIGIYNLVNNVADNQLSATKLDYINNRLGTSLTLQDCANLKINLNIGDLITTNHLKLTRDERIVHQLNDGFVGFISFDNAFINMRNIGIVKNLYKSIDERYVNYNIFGKYDNTCRFYTIPSTINLYTKDKIKLHIAEGGFDILSIYLNVRKTFGSNTDVYTSVGGSGYKGILRFFINLFKVPNLEIHLYPDNDQSRYVITDIVKYIQIFRYPIYIHRNIFPNEKDFGVPVQKIKETIERII